MYRIFKPLKDAYITDRVTNGVRQYNSNVGIASSLDLFKLYGATYIASGSTKIMNNELSRILIKFDTSGLAADVTAGLIDTNSPSFNCSINMFDVYGGQTVPSNFTLIAYPLSQSFDEGGGNDVVFYQDQDICNFLTASSKSTWFLSGANAKGGLGSPGIDIITSGNLNDGNGTVNLFVTQSFIAGTENLSLDVTKIISATLAGTMPDFGFRISFSGTQETDISTRFVKRFSSRHAVDTTKRPQLVVKYDDSLRDNQANFLVNVPGTVFMFNKVRGALSNVVSGSTLTQLTGTNCITLRLEAPISGGIYSASFTGSQHKQGVSYIPGIYSASFTLLSSTPAIQNLLVNSGTLNFTQIWSSNDGTVGFLTSSNFTVNLQQGDTSNVQPTKYYVTALNMNSTYKNTAIARVRVNIENVDFPYVKAVKIPIVSPSVIVDGAFYSVRDAISKDTIIPFDTALNSTRLSSDGKNMFFDLYMTTLTPGKNYTIDIMLLEGSTQKIYQNVCAPFKIDAIV
jgi:hypothetical protein